MNKLMLTCVCVCVLGAAGYGQMTVKNSSQETVMQVSDEGKVEIADSLTVKALENTSGNESSLVGVDKNGTLVKSNLDLMQQGLIFFPTDNATPIVDSFGQPTATDTLVSALDIEARTGVSIPDEATHILVKYMSDHNLNLAPAGKSYNGGTLLYLGATETEKKWISHIDMGAYNNSGDREAQASGSVVVKLSPQKTIYYNLHHHCSTRLVSVSDIFGSTWIGLYLSGYYVPLSTLLKQQ